LLPAVSHRNGTALFLSVDVPSQFQEERTCHAGCPQSQEDLHHRFGGTGTGTSDVSFSDESGESSPSWGVRFGKTTLLTSWIVDKPTSARLFWKAARFRHPDNALAAFRRIISDLSPGLYLLDTFSLQTTSFCHWSWGQETREMAECLAPIARGLGIEDNLSKNPRGSADKTNARPIARALITNIACAGR
jgi:hypothetical protein